MVISDAFQSELLTNSWKRCWEDTTHVKNDLLRDTIIWKYSEPCRYYHNISHLVGSLLVLKEVYKLADNPQLVELAIWVHDVIYSTTISNNEYMSACFFHDECKKLGVEWANSISHIIKYCNTLVLATAHTIDKDISNDAKLICDIDLVTLGADDYTFGEYCNKIRKEYSAVADEVYYPERLRIIKTFLHRGGIYKTPYFVEKYESSAIDNLSCEIVRLKGIINSL